MFEVMATLAILVIGGAFVGLFAVAGLVFVSLLKLMFIPLAAVLDGLKWIFLLIVVPLILLVVVPLALLVIVPLILAAIVPVLVGLVVALPIILLVLVGQNAAHAV